jgi:hypothetical protein
MMEQIDIRLLNEMLRAITSFRADETDVGQLADGLLMLRDGLRFKDPDWSHELTQHIVTLDSASTFVPANDDQSRQLRAAITTATDGLLQLIEAKLAERNVGETGDGGRNSDGN